MKRLPTVLMVLGVVALLAVLLYPRQAQPGPSARTAKCIHNLKQIELALERYRTETHAANLTADIAVLREYGLSEANLFCPAARHLGRSGDAYTFVDAPKTVDGHPALIVCRHHGEAGVITVLHTAGWAKAYPLPRANGSE